MWDGVKGITATINSFDGLVRNQKVSNERGLIGDMWWRKTRSTSESCRGTERLTRFYSSFAMGRPNYPENNQLSLLQRKQDYPKCSRNRSHFKDTRILCSSGLYKGIMFARTPPWKGATEFFQGSHGYNLKISQNTMLNSQWVLTDIPDLKTSHYMKKHSRGQFKKETTCWSNPASQVASLDNMETFSCQDSSSGSHFFKHLK